MGDKAHVRLIDTHAEGDGGNNNHPVFTQEPLLVMGTLFRGQACMIGQSGIAFLGQGFRGGVDFVPGQAVDDAAIALMFGFNKIQ